MQPPFLTAILCAALLGLSACAQPSTTEVRVGTADELRRAVTAARPGSRVLLAPGDYPGGFSFSGLKGEAARMIVIGAADPARPPRFTGGGSGMHLSEVAYLQLRDLVFSGARGNGLNLDDGGSFETPSHHVILSNLTVREVGPTGNRDGIKLSGVDDFRVENCTIEQWGAGGSGIDMVGCHRGVIRGCTFRSGGSNGVQAKGGSENITILHNRFLEPGGRGVNLGGSTGLPYFRPRPQGFEARSIHVTRNVFVGGQTPVAFVGVDGATVRFNTIYHPGRWALRILQENQAPDFVASRNGVFGSNIIVFRSGSWSEGGVNIGPKTAPQTFTFARNLWYCEDQPERSAPRLPTPETDPIIGKDPLFRDPAKHDFRLKPGSPAEGLGATVPAK